MLVHLHVKNLALIEDIEVEYVNALYQKGNQC